MELMVLHFYFHT